MERPLVNKRKQKNDKVQTGRSGVLVKLQSSIDHFPVALARAAKYILENPEKVIHQSLADLSSFSGCGQATIMRLCKELGFDGYTGFRIALSGDLAVSGTLSDAQARNDDELDQVVLQINQSVADTRALIDQQTLKTVAKRLKSAARIDVFGVGVSGVIADLISYRLLRAGCSAFALRDGVLAHEVSVGLGPKAAAIAISQSGSTPETIKFAQNAKKSGAFTLAITCRPRRGLAKIADETLVMAQLRAPSFGGPITDVPRAVMIAEALAAAIQRPLRQNS